MQRETTSVSTAMRKPDSRLASGTGWKLTMPAMNMAAEGTVRP